MVPVRDPLGSACRLLKPLFRSRPARPAQWRSVLIVRPCCIGDVLQSTALVAALRRALPEAHIGYAVGSWSRPVLAGNLRIDSLVDTGAVVGGATRGPGDYLSLLRAIRRGPAGGRWDACFILERSPIFSALAWLAGIPDRIGPDSGGRGLALTVPVPVRPRRQEAEACLDLARAVGIGVDGAATEFYPSPADDAEAERALAGLDGPIVVLAPGGGVNPGTALVSKRWPADRFGALAARLAARGYRVVALGGPQDQAVAEDVVAFSGNLVENLCGRLSLSGCGALIRRAALFIGNDTGLMHLAAAVATPVVALFGPTDPAIYGPFGDRHRVIWHLRSCSPCFRGERREGCAQECMESTTVDEVEAAALDLLF